MPAAPLAHIVQGFTDHLLRVDLPRLPPERRTETAAFATRRIAAMPAPMRSAVAPVAALVHAAGIAVGAERFVRLLARCPLPGLSDYVRLVRSVSYAYVWDRWPSTASDGAPR